MPQPPALLPLTPSWTWPIGQVPHIRTAGRFAMVDRDFSYEWRHSSHALHLHDYHGQLSFAGELVELQPGDVTLTTGGMATRYRLIKPGWHWCIHLEPAESVSGPVLTLPRVIRGMPSRWVAETISRIARHHHQAISTANGIPLLASAAGSAALELLCILANTAGDGRLPATSRSDLAVEQVAELIRSNPADPRGPGEFARDGGISPNWLAARFRERFGTTIQRYQLHHRITLASYLLANSDQSIREIGKRVGIPDSHRFNKEFRQVMGSAPSHFRVSAGDPRQHVVTGKER